MKAILPTTHPRNAKNYANGKETTDSWTVTVATPAGLREAVNFRCYMGRSKSSSRVYGSLWVYGAQECSGSGSGFVDGGGYDKVSAALQEAIDSAGIKLREDDSDKPVYVDGRGYTATRKALEAIARAAFPDATDVLVIEN